MTFLVLLLALFQQQHLINIIMELVNIDQHMNSMHIKLNYDNSKRFGLAQMVIITCLFLLKISLQYFSYSTAILVMYSVFNLVDYINTIMLFQYVNLVLLIRQRFIWLNRRLRQIRRHPTYLNKCRLSLIPKLNYNSGNTSMIRKMEIETLLIDLAKIYAKLCSLSRFVNRTYNVQILITVASRFLMITTQLINTYNTIRDRSSEQVTQYIVLSLYICLHFFKILMVASVSENTASKVIRHDCFY